MIENLRVSIIDDIMIEEFFFYDGFVSATLGTKNGAVCASILNYKQIDERTVIIDNSSFEIKWDNIVVGEEIITVKRNGIDTSYKIIATVIPSKLKRKLP